MFSSGYVYFKTRGYLPTNLANWQKKHTNKHSEYGVYLNEDSDIAKCHIYAYKRCSDDKLKKIYEKQEKHSYSCVTTYPNAPFIVFKKKQEE